MTKAIEVYYNNTYVCISHKGPGDGPIGMLHRLFLNTSDVLGCENYMYKTTSCEELYEDNFERINIHANDSQILGPISEKICSAIDGQLMSNVVIAASVLVSIIIVLFLLSSISHYTCKNINEKPKVGISYSQLNSFFPSSDDESDDEFTNDEFLNRV